MRSSLAPRHDGAVLKSTECRHMSRCSRVGIDSGSLEDLSDLSEFESEPGSSGISTSSSLTDDRASTYGELLPPMRGPAHVIVTSGGMHAGDCRESDELWL